VAGGVSLRSGFGNHGFVEIGGNVYDATVGPFVGTLNEANYVTNAIDSEPFDVALRNALYTVMGMAPAACAGRSGVAGDVNAASEITIR
jgi:hypothetical protein